MSPLGLLVGLVRWPCGWWFAEDFLMERLVIIPRIDVVGNERRVDRDALYFVWMALEKGFQAASRVEIFEFLAVVEVD